METLFLVIPCYNEEEALPETARVLNNKLTQLINAERIRPESKILFVDDGSKDQTWSLITSLSEQPHFEGIKLAHNRGHQNALLAGLMEARKYCDVTISMDADLQDDIDAIDRMLDERENGCEIVYGVRGSRATDTAFKRVTAEGYYKVLAALGVEIVFNAADFRLMSSRSLEALSEHREVNLFLRGIVPSLGFKTAEVVYNRKERNAGESKYPLKKMLALAWQGVTSFSVQPLRLIAAAGVLFCAVSCVGLIAELILSLCGIWVERWLILLAFMGLFSGVQLLALGIVGSYIGKIYGEVKARPRYILERNTLSENASPKE